MEENGAYSAYLHALRFLSALLVLSHHAAFEPFGGKDLPWTGGLAHEAVIVFFVLSGFVIAYVRESREITLPLYAAGRLSRLWSVVLPAIVGTVLLDALGRAVAPEFYALAGQPADWLGVLGAATFTSQLWLENVPLGSNVPFWSLSYEAAYYVLFAALTFGTRRALAVVLWLLAVGPRIALLLPAWALGFAAYRLARKELRQPLALLLALCGAALAICAGLFKPGSQLVAALWVQLFDADLADTLRYAKDFVTDDLMALGLAAHLIGLSSLLRGVRLPARASRLVASVSDGTFALYLFHYPLLHCFSALSLAFLGRVHGVAVTLSTLVVAMLLAAPTNALRRPLRRSGLALLARLQQARTRRTAVP